MSNQNQLAGLTIRDAVPADIPLCHALDHTYQTDFVWQINIQGDSRQRNISLRQERLPRSMDVTYTPYTDNLSVALSGNEAFLIAANRDNSQLYGYLVMTQDKVKPTATLRDIVVSKAYRRQGVATRLLSIARRWALSHNIERIFAQTQTKNFPAIQLLQKTGYAFCGYNDQYFENQDIAIFFAQALH
ncbi:MAG: GNAT family N-acetyltransferase [Chloroflexota bacterium]